MSWLLLSVHTRLRKLIDRQWCVMVNNERISISWTAWKWWSFACRHIAGSRTKQRAFLAFPSTSIPLFYISICSLFVVMRRTSSDQHYQLLIGHVGECERWRCEFQDKNEYFMLLFSLSCDFQPARELGLKQFRIPNMILLWFWVSLMDLIA